MGLCQPDGWKKAWTTVDADGSGALDVEETIKVVKSIFEEGKPF